MACAHIISGWRRWRGSSIPIYSSSLRPGWCSLPIAANTARPRLRTSHANGQAPWEDFASVTSQSFVRDLLPRGSLTVTPDMLIDMQTHRKRERMEACDGHDPIRILLAYAQNELVFNDRGAMAKAATRTAYEASPRERRVNKFGLAYRRTLGFSCIQCWLTSLSAPLCISIARKAGPPCFMMACAPWKALSSSIILLRIATSPRACWRCRDRARTIKAWPSTA